MIFCNQLRNGTGLDSDKKKLATDASLRFIATSYYSPAIFMAGNKIEPH